MTGDLTGNVIEPELGRQMLDEIGDLNAGFVQLLLRHHAARAADAETVLALPVAQADRIASLGTAARRRLTHCAFALFDLRLADDDFWREANDATPGRYRRHDSDQPAMQREVELFTLAALMQLRHLAVVNRFLAGLSFGARETVLDATAQLSLMQLQALVAKHPGLLCCRLGTRPDAWRVLVQLARRTDGQPLLPARILGFQHSASR